MDALRSINLKDISAPRPISPTGLSEWCNSVEQLEMDAENIRICTKKLRGSYEVYRMLEEQLQEARVAAARDQAWSKELTETWKEMRISRMPRSWVCYVRDEQNQVKPQLSPDAANWLATQSTVQLKPILSVASKIIRGTYGKGDDDPAFVDLRRWMEDKKPQLLKSLHVFKCMHMHYQVRCLENRKPKLAARAQLLREVVKKADTLHRQLSSLTQSALSSLQKSESVLESLTEQVKACTPDNAATLLLELRDAVEQKLNAEQSMKVTCDAEPAVMLLQKRLIGVLDLLRDIRPVEIDPARVLDTGDRPIPVCSYNWSQKTGLLTLHCRIPVEQDCECSYRLYWDQELGRLLLRCTDEPSTQEGTVLRFDLSNVPLDHIRNGVPELILQARVADHTMHPEHVTRLRPSKHDVPLKWSPLPQ